MNLARAVRKVSRANTKAQKKDKKLSKKWIISIVSVVLLICIGVGVGLGVYYTNQPEEAYISDKIYFSEPIKDTNGNEVTFNKENYQAIQRYIDKGTISEHTFIFVYDGSAYYADEQDEDTYNKDYVELMTRLADLQYTVNTAKAAGQSVELYVVDVHVDSAVNAGILSDSSFGSLVSEDKVSYEPAFIYIEGDQFKAEVEYDGQTHKISTSVWTDVFNSSIRFAINFINSLN